MCYIWGVPGLCLTHPLQPRGRCYVHPGKKGKQFSLCKVSIYKAPNSPYYWHQTFQFAYLH